uniref:Glutathione transferase n=1 Tax=Caenorhabditis japonica TaxID=281687 RepID=A0A8R1E0G1_CAEJA
MFANARKKREKALFVVIVAGGSPTSNDLCPLLFSFLGFPYDPMISTRELESVAFADVSFRSNGEFNMFFFKKKGKSSSKNKYADVPIKAISLPTVHENPIPQKKASSSGRHLIVSVSSTTQRNSKASPSPKSKMDSMQSFLVPTYTLHDFDDGEECKVVRMIFQLGGVPYEFKHVHRDDYILEDYPFYALPALEMNDRKYGSVLSICRHLAWRYNLSGQTAYDDAKVDDIAEKVFDVRMRIKNWIDHIEHAPDHACDEECTDNAAARLLTDTLFPCLERVLKAAPSSWLVGHRMTWADLLVACLVNPIIYHRPKLLQDFPQLYLHNEKVAHHDDLVGFLYHVRTRKFQEKNY